MIITEENGEISEDGSDETGMGQEISLLSMIDNYIDGLPYTDQIKQKLKEVSTRMYNETTKELEEKRSYENTQY